MAVETICDVWPRLSVGKMCESFQPRANVTPVPSCMSKTPKPRLRRLGSLQPQSQHAYVLVNSAHNPFPLPSRAQTQTDTHARPHTYIFACIHTLTYSLTYLELSASNKKKEKHRPAAGSGPDLGLESGLDLPGLC